MTDTDPSRDGAAVGEAPRGEARGEIGRTVQAELARLDGLALEGHPDVYQEIHGGLRAALADIDDA